MYEFMYDEDHFIQIKQELEDEEIDQKEGIEAGFALMEQEGLNSIHFEEKIRPSEKSSEGPSENSSLTYYGGRPCVPEGFEWPYYEGVNWEGVKKNRPLSFIAQFDCYDLRPYDKEHVLPEKGVLSFFYELASSWQEPDGLVAGRVKVFHFDSTDSLQLAEFPQDLDEEYMLPQKDLELWSVLDTPQDGFYYSSDSWTGAGSFAESLLEIINNAEDGITDPCDSRWETIHGQLLFHPKDFPDLVDKAIATFNGGPGGSHLLGYPNFFQGDEFEKYEPGSWRLLLQIDSDSIGDSKLSDATENGVVFFAIPTQDLIEHNFEQVVGTVQIS